MTSDERIATAFNGLAHTKRVGIFRALLKRHPKPMVFGDISTCCSIPPSTLKHHLQEMEAANILTRQASGRSTVFQLNIGHLETILRSFLGECCSTTDTENSK